MSTEKGIFNWDKFIDRLYFWEILQAALRHLISVS